MLNANESFQYRGFAWRDMHFKCANFQFTSGKDLKFQPSVCVCADILVTQL